jgi:hypothetical protein
MVGPVVRALWGRRGSPERYNCDDGCASNSFQILQQHIKGPV